jgi:hypothetical protein
MQSNASTYLGTYRATKTRHRHLAPFDRSICLVRVDMHVIRKVANGHVLATRLKTQESHPGLSHKVVDCSTRGYLGRLHSIQYSNAQSTSLGKSPSSLRHSR